MKRIFIPKGMGTIGFSLLAVMMSLTIGKAETNGPVPLVVKDQIDGEPLNEKAAPVGAQQEYTVSGTVLDEENNPLAGVSVVLKGTDTGTATDLDGKFAFPKALSENDVLVFSYLGYDTMQYKVKANESSTLDITIAFESAAVELMGAVVVDGVYKSKRNIFQKIGDLFR